MKRPPTESLGAGFFHHGVATPVSNHRGTVATADGQGRDLVLVWLFDNRGGYALLSIDAESGSATEHPMPFPPGGDCPYASILSSRNKYYTHFNSHFVEFDPRAGEFTFWQQTAPQMAMGMTEDDQGRIWSVSYPDSGVACFDPQTRAFVDYGHVYRQNWNQYQRYVAADDSGWLYFGIGNTASQLIAFAPDGRTAQPLLSEAERGTGSAYVYRDLDGKVYGLALAGQEAAGWCELYRGAARKIASAPPRRAKPIITASQSLFHRDFPSCRRLESCDLVERRLVVADPRTGQRWEHHFEYSSEGAHLMGLATAPDDTICGGTAFPMRFFRYDPASDSWENRASYSQWNTVARQGDRFFVGGYPGGFLLEWDPGRAWVPTAKDDPGGNPLFLGQWSPSIYRPHCLLAHPDGRTLVLSSTPAYGYTGGGLLFWDRESGTSTLLEHTDLLPQHSTMSLVALEEKNQLLGGTTTSPGTGGEKKAAAAELYLLDMERKEVVWHHPVFAAAQEYTDLYCASADRVYGFVDRTTFFVFDPSSREIVHRQETEKTCYHQGPRVFVRGDDGTLYVLFEAGIARIEETSFEIQMLARAPVPIRAGGDFLNGRIYFSSGSHLYSYQVDPQSRAAAAR